MKHIVTRSSALLGTLLMLAGCGIAGNPAASVPTPKPSATATPASTPRPSPTATQAPTPAPSTGVPDIPGVNASVAWYLSHMSLDEKLGQLIIFQTNATSYTPEVDQMVRQYHAGGIIMYGYNMVSPSQVKSFTANMQSHATIPLFIGTDEEGGLVDRLAAFYPAHPSAQSLGASGDPQRAYASATSAAKEMRALGMNLDFAPVVDVRLTPNAFEQSRLFGSSVSTVDRYASQFLSGLQQNNVIGTLKHWPGIGSLVQDPHATLPSLNRTPSQLDATEFAAFRALLPENPGMIMVTHVIVPGIDPALPATLSSKLVTGVLRGQLHYQGVVITDDLNMEGITLHYSVPQAAVMAIEAGDDLALGISSPAIMQQTLDALHSAIQSGQISQQRIDESVDRILALKIRFGVLPMHTGSATPQATP